MDHLPFSMFYLTSSVWWKQTNVILCLASTGAQSVAHKSLQESAVLENGYISEVLHSWNFYFIWWNWISSFHPSSNSSPQKSHAGEFHQRIKIWLCVESWLWPGVTFTNTSAYFQLCKHIWYWLAIRHPLTRLFVFRVNKYSMTNLCLGKEQIYWSSLFKIIYFVYHS